MMVYRRGEVGRVSLSREPGSPTAPGLVFAAVRVSSARVNLGDTNGVLDSADVVDGYVLVRYVSDTGRVTLVTVGLPDRNGSWSVTRTTTNPRNAVTIRLNVEKP